LFLEEVEMNSIHNFRRPRTFAGIIAALVLVTLGVWLTVNSSVRAQNRNSVSNASYPVASGTRSRLANVPQQSYADLVAQVSPAVVTIRSARRVRQPNQFPFMDDPFFQRFFGNRMPNGGGDDEDNAPRSGRPRSRGRGGNGGNFALERALGSGVIVRNDGYILTNHHVVDGAEEITVELTDRRTLDAKLIGSDAPSDLAVLKINAGNLPTLPLGDSDKVRVGDVVLAIGNPMGIGQTVTAGIISAKERTTGLSSGSFEDFLQTDAAINQGNSGGALVDTQGELIGINSQILSPSGGNIGIGFAIPSNMAKSVMGQLISGGKVRRSQIGVGIQMITSDIASSMNLPNLNGVLVNSVRPGSPAEHAGIKQGDVILSVNGTPVSDTNSLRNLVASSAPGTDLNLQILRGGHQQALRVHTEEFSDQNSADMNDNGGGSSPSRGERLGVSVQSLTPDLAQQYNIPRNVQGVVVTDVDPAGAAAEAGLQPGDVLVEVNRQPVRSANDVRSAMDKSGANAPVLLLVNHGGQSIYVTVRPGSGTNSNDNNGGNNNRRRR
jgi:Do/DeqQ family serine protease